MKAIYQKIFLLIFVLAAFEAQALNKIKSISIEGNEYTQLSVFERLITVQVGDDVNIDKISRSAQSIMNLELFSDVTYTLNNNGDDYDLIFNVKEKYYFLVLPLLKYRDGELHKGFHLIFENLFGLNHQLNYLYENKGSHNGVTEYRQRLKYTYPWFLDSKQTLGVQFISENTVNNQLDGTFLNDKDKIIAVNSQFWLNDVGIPEGDYIGVGFGISQRDQENITTKIITNSISANSFSLIIGSDKTQTRKFNRAGRHYAYAITAASRLIGSETTYYKHELTYTSYYTFTSRPEDNLNVYAAIGHSTDDILNEPAFTLGSRNHLRGYDRGRYKGNTMYVMNTEYITPSNFSPKFRYVAFVDTGATSKNINSILDQRLKVGVGFGFRWKIPSFVRLDIRMDIAYGLDDKTTYTLFATRHTF